MTRLERDAPPNEAPQLTAPAFGDCWLAWELAPSLLSARDRGQRGSRSGTIVRVFDAVFSKGRPVRSWKRRRGVD